MNKNFFEEWKPIVGYEGYAVSNLGNVKSVERTCKRRNDGSMRRVKEKIKKPTKLKNGYYSVQLYNDGARKIQYIHRLVAEAFIPNPDNLPWINHKDEDKTNNNVSNLEWCTQKYNTNYGTGIEKRVAHTDFKTLAEKQKNRPDLSKTVYQYEKDGKTLVNKWTSTMEAQRQTGFSRKRISEACNNRYNPTGLTHNVYKGYIWSFTPLV